MAQARYGDAVAPASASEPGERSGRHFPSQENVVSFLWPSPGLGIYAGPPMIVSALQGPAARARAAQPPPAAGGPAVPAQAAPAPAVSQREARGEGAGRAPPSPHTCPAEPRQAGGPSGTWRKKPDPGNLGRPGPQSEINYFRLRLPLLRTGLFFRPLPPSSSSS